jgi:adenylate kinase
MPNAGKGTLVADMKKDFDFDLVSVGQALRDEVATGSELGKYIKKLQDEGLLVDMDIVMRVLDNMLKNSTKDIMVFDGFPRNLAQAEAFDNISSVDMVLHLTLPKEVAIERSITRLTCKKCGFISSTRFTDSKICPECGGEFGQRSDDTLEGMTKRLETYEKETYPLIDFYKKRGVVIDIDSSLGSEHTYEVVKKAIRDYNQK